MCFDTEDRREKKAYEVDYVAHNTIHLRRIQNIQIDQVVNILGKSKYTCMDDIGIDCRMLE